MACAAIIITVNNLNVVVFGADVFSLEHSFVSLQVLLGRWRSSLINCFFTCVLFKHNFQSVLIKFQTKMAEIQIHVDPMEEEAFLRAYSDITFPP